MTPTTSPFGSWPTPITPSVLASGSISVGALVSDGAFLWWSQSLPDEGGRRAVFLLQGDAPPCEVTPPGAKVGTRVHTYGGGSWWAENGVLVYSDEVDGRLRLLSAQQASAEDLDRRSAPDPSAPLDPFDTPSPIADLAPFAPFDPPEPLLLTPAAGHHYADGRFSTCGSWYVCVRERPAPAAERDPTVPTSGDPASGVPTSGVPTSGVPTSGVSTSGVETPTGALSEDAHEIVCVATDGSERVELVAQGADFYAAPRPSPCGRYLLWLQWNHPNMPWDGTELWVSRFDAPSVCAALRIAGGSEEWIFGPSWRHDGAVLWVSDAGGCSRLMVLETDVLENALEDGCLRREPRTWVELTDGEIQVPNWVFGMSRYASWPDASGDFTHLAYAVSRLGGHELRFTTDVSTETSVYAEHTEFASLSAWSGGVVAVASSYSVSNEIIRVVGTSPVPTARTLHAPAGFSLGEDFVPAPEPITFPTDDGFEARALFYRPANPHRTGGKSQLPPLLVVAHGGPTGAARTGLSLPLRAWTSRGIAVVDVDYRGSTGYGRDYRQALDRNWGVADVADCISAARFLADLGAVDPDRIAFKGSSAGAMTALLALADSDLFTAGIILYGVTDLEALAKDTHKFESRYLDRLVGPYPQARKVYRDRSPLNRAHEISCPLLILQGSDDRVVPPEQAEALLEILAERCLPHAFVLFEGEGHGFRKTENLITAAEAELSFLGQVFGFEPDGRIRHVELQESHGNAARK